MKSYMRGYSGLRPLTILVFFIAVCGIVIAGDSNEKKDEQEVLTPLEQQMLKKVSVTFRDTPIDDVLRVMAEQANVDIIKSPQVTGTVTATLTDVPLREALDNILAAHGYGYVADKNVIRIAPLAELAQKAEALVSRIYRITYTDVTEVEKTLEKFISQRGSISCNPGTSNIIVTDTESRIKAMDTFITEIDRITPQILVEVRIYDIKSQDKLDLGVQWEAGRLTDYSAGGLSKNPSNHTFPFIIGGFTTATDKAKETTGAMRFGWLDSAIDIDVLISAEHENVNAKLLANPRILVLDNEKALFDIVTEHPYVERTESGGVIKETVRFKPIGTKLEVTPHVTREGMLRLHIMPEFGVKVDDVDLISGTVPVIDTRKVDTITLVKDGQTVVIGGLRKKEVSQQINKIPLLGDIPLLGALFRFEGEDTVNSEIVVFITPRIIIKEAVMSEAEQQAFEATEFGRPDPIITKAEKKSKSDQK